MRWVNRWTGSVVSDVGRVRLGRPGMISGKHRLMGTIAQVDFRIMLVFRSNIRCNLRSSFQRLL
jgi:hypothetical protein